MQELTHIFINIILPVFIQIGLGYIIQKKFNIGVNAQVKLLIYAVIPAVLFTSAYNNSVENSIALSIVVYCIALFSLMYIAGRVFSRFMGLSVHETGAFTNSVMFFNSANYSLPLMELIYKDSYAVSLLIIVIMVSSTLTYSVGVFNASMGNSNIGRSLLNIFKLPTIYSIAAGFLIRLLNVELWSPVNSALEMLGRGLIPLSLTTIGAQLAQTRFVLKNPRVYLSNSMRLLLSPLFAFIIVKLLGLEGMVAQVLVISAAAPTAVNTIILAIEYDNEPVFASRSVFSSTMLSALTVSAVIYLSTTFL